MLLPEINFSSADDYIHLERYVNRGSPSGFSEIYTTSSATTPKFGNSNFFLGSVDIPKNIRYEDFGVKPDFFTWGMLVHPDMFEKQAVLLSTCVNPNGKAVRVAPTASARTVMMVDEPLWFLKLNYKGLLGRIDRTVGRAQAQSAIEVSRRIESAIMAGCMPDKFKFMREVFARVIYLPLENEVHEWGIVLREPIPFPVPSNQDYLIPAFALFSSDDKYPDHPTILKQLIAAQTKPVERFLFDDIIAPIFDSYFSLLLTCGLQLECHAQNSLISIDNNVRVTGFIAKDAESIDKDFSLMKNLGIHSEFESTSYKCLRSTDYNYQIMHSFMFDFKLGQYLIDPIIEDAKLNFEFDESQLISRIKLHNRNYIRQLPADFFPKDGMWYNYANVVHDRSKPRPYVANPHPKYR